LLQFRELLSKVPFQFQFRRLEVSPKLQSLAVPRASVYILDAYSQHHLAEVLIAWILARYPKARFIVLSGGFSEAEAFSLLHIGVKGLLDYSEAGKQLPQALEAVASGGFWVRRTLLARFLDSILNVVHARRFLGGAANVSRREKEILHALLENLSNKEIAKKLNISERTVKFHVASLLRKYGVQRRTDLILLYFQHAPGPDRSFR